MEDVKQFLEDLNKHIESLVLEFRIFSQKSNLSQADKALIQNFFKEIFKIQSFYEKNKPDLKKLNINSAPINLLQDDLNKNYELLYKAGMILNSTLDTNELLNLAVDTIIELAAAGRGFLALVDSKGSYSLTVARNADKESLEKAKAEVSNTVIKRVIDSKKDLGRHTQLYVNSLLDKSSIMSTGFDAIACVPILLNDQIKAVLYLDQFKKELDLATFSLMKSFAAQLAGFLKNTDTFVELKTAQSQLLNQLKNKYQFDQIICKSESMAQVLKTVSKVADTVATILIQGESGTGKDLIARALHNNSSRKSANYIEVDCGALPENLIESELFGHKKGAFTGANFDKVGLLEAASGGTLFLDEIANMPSDLQSKLLRALQGKKIRRIGDTHEIPIDFRLIVASSKNIKEAVASGEFREDLFFRINTITLYLAPLRERKEDILELAIFFCAKYSKIYGKNLNGMTPDYMRALEGFEWKGNVRELEHIIERSVILTENDRLSSEDLPEEFDSLKVERKSPAIALVNESQLPLEDFINDIKKQYVIKVLDECDGKKVDAAKKLGIDRSYLFTLIKKFELPY